MNMVETFFVGIIKIFYLFLPVYLANSSPVVFQNFFKSLAKPVDFGKKINNKRIFGDHKTIRGIILASITGIIVAFFQFLLYNVSFFQKISFIDYSNINFLFFGFLMGFGAIFGDLIKSFFKRQIGIKPGHDFFFFDQTDYILGSYLFAFYYLPKSILFFIYVLIISIFMHILGNYLGDVFFNKNKKK